MREIKLIGPRVILRPLKISDAPDIYSNIQDPKITERIVGIPYPFKLRDAKKFIQEAKRKLRAKKEVTLGIELKDKKEIIGCVILYDVGLILEHEIAFWLGKKYRGQKLIIEVLNLVLNFAFKKLKFHRIFGNVSGDNLVSQKIFKKLGFKKEGRHREAYWRQDRWADSISYGLLAREFLRKNI
jgi:RimJ/RimL family protein N-acetyltransferase